jgi:hypothetical protein
MPSQRGEGLWLTSPIAEGERLLRTSRLEEYVLSAADSQGCSAGPAIGLHRGGAWVTDWLRSGRPGRPQWQRGNRVRGVALGDTLWGVTVGG